jgi:diguanylate cyclase (GGDEF)-like protein/PAS domain S-box-containing protein
LKTKRIRLRLGVAFAILIALLAGIGQFGLRRMQTIDKSLSDITGRKSTDLDLARRAMTISNENNRIVMELVLVENRRLVEPLLAARSQNSNEVTKLVEGCESLCRSRKEKQLLSEIKRTRQPYLESCQRAIHLLVDERKHEEAETVMVNETLPALHAYHAAWEQFVEFRKEELEAAIKQAQDDNAKARRVASLLIGLAVALAVVIALFATRETALEMAARIDAEKEVSKLNVGLEERVIQRTSELSETIKHVTLQAAALEAHANAIVITDFRGTIQWVNHAFTTMTGYSVEEVLGKNARLLNSGKQSQSFYADLWSTISSGKVWHGELINRRKDGTTYIEEQTITPLAQNVGEANWTHFVSIKQDITERKRAEEMLQNNENKYRALFEDSADANWLMDEKGFLDCNASALKMFGYSAGTKIMHPADISPLKQADGTSSRTASERKIAAAFLNGQERFEWLHQRRNGNVFPAEVCLTALALSGEPRLLATVRDITERKQIEETLLFKTALLEAQAETAIDGILAVDESDHIILANRQFGLIFEIPDELLLTRNDIVVRNHVSDRVEDPDAFDRRVRYLNSNRDEKSRDELRFKNGKIFDRYSAPLVDAKGRYRGRIWYFRDITDRKLAEERVQVLAFYDALTGLPNRTLLQDRLSKALASARRRGDKVALLYLDLDRFKDINDSQGHSVGDLLLQQVAERLKTCAREQDTVARLGGDEFLITLTQVRDLPDVAVAAERLMDAMTSEFSLRGYELNISCSIGISIFPENGTDCETLIKNADAAMYSAKENGRNGIRFFTQEMNAQVAERLTLEHSLRLALERKELILMYQPQMDIATGKITGLEALLRWQHPELGLVPPGKFIRIAENCGLIVPIGEWVLRNACSQARKWQDQGIPPVSVAVNVSAVQFRQENFCELIRSVLRETGFPPQLLELELTEGLLLANADLMFSVIRELKDIGVTLAIDDFGTGYSSFGYLRQFQVSKLKIDGSFIRHVATNPNDAAIAAAIISMAKNLNLKVIAEGVENEEQMSFLRAHHCDEIQGYYFSKPLPVEKVADKLRGGHSAPKALAQGSGTQSS